MTYEEICEKLQKSEISNARGECEILWREFCPDISLTDDCNDKKLIEAVERRCQHYPLQYILGKWWFARCEFFVDENCLVPRPDTECVVEEAVKLLPENGRFADLCTGSGCIAVSLADLRHDLRGYAVELYPKTLELAAKNAEHNGVADRIEFRLGDVLDKNCLGNRSFDSIISNPPYIKTEVLKDLEAEVKQEPIAALDGGEDGMIFYRAIVKNFSRNLSENGNFIFEIGYDQASDIKAIAAEHGFFCSVKKDLGGHDRIAVLSRM